jgi:chondroitin sulfate synthase
VFTRQSVDRIRNAVVQGAQIYLPIVYSEYYHENRPGAAVSDGYFRQFGFGLVALYKSDVIDDGFNKDINGWGLEDVQFLEKYMSTASEMALFRAPDPTLVHVYHPIVCDSNLDETQYKMCLGTKANTIGNYQILANNFFDDKSLLKSVRASSSNS